ncbi:sugar phosphate nucleotidyltransferase [Glaciecola petra]|uniref:Sugar phosphate nucleotidyltransferase n=1 Tax=Glaciecola petra TaxID=3075602 RepID=A0ABU2ZN50_9ALTE|nr:sugar phosphate nucleotidyltransferase [Aestuariibacter sp. P117]MDT0593769.1 sugar phosphate nucleotidyltransferase [Aestuariibacter sp. P117]
MKTVILCGGRGTRAYPYTEHFPKPMMPINGTPIIVHLMKVFAAQGFTEFVLAAGHKQELLIDYFDGRFPDWDIRIVDTGDDADTGQRIARCGSFVGDKFFATYGDGLGNVDLHKLLENHNKSERLATLTTVPLRAQYGLVVYDEDCKVQRFEEKPLVDNYWINAGFMVFEHKALFDWQGKNLEQEVLPYFAEKEQLYVSKHRGFWKSMDTSKDQSELEDLLIDGRAPWQIPQQNESND